MKDKRIPVPGTSLPALYPLGLGCVGAGTKWKGEKAEEILDYYVENGGNVLDTARVYTTLFGSEPELGRWFARSGKRNRVVLITKGGHASFEVPKPDIHKVRLSREEMKEDLELSLRDLQTDCIDVYLYHRDDRNRSVEELIETMESFVKEGKIRYYGCSNWTLPRIEEAVSYCERRGYRGFVMNEALINAGSAYMNPPFDDTLAVNDQRMQEFHKVHPEITAVAFAGNCGGFFQQYLRGESMVKDRAYLTEKNRLLAEKLDRLSKERGVTMLQAVLGYFDQLDFPCLPLYGPRNLQDIREAMEGMEISFGREDYQIGEAFL